MNLNTNKKIITILLINLKTNALIKILKINQKNGLDIYFAKVILSFNNHLFSELSQLTTKMNFD